MLDFLRRDWYLLLLLLIGAGVLAYKIETRYVPCETQIGFYIAQDDPQFKMSEAQLQKNLETAAAVWNAAIGKDIIVFNQQGDLPVYLTYDKRQRAVETAASTGALIDAEKVDAKKLANEYGTLKKQFDTLQMQGTATNEMAKQLDALSTSYNHLITKINSDIAAYNRAVPKSEFSEGEYISDNQGFRIFIYSYQTNIELERVLIHELGHALGLDHVANKDSIMYPENDSENLSLTDEDLAELAKVCAK